MLSSLWMGSIHGELGDGEILQKSGIFNVALFWLILGKAVPDWVSALNDELEEFSVKWNDLESNSK